MVKYEPQNLFRYCFGQQKCTQQCTGGLLFHYSQERLAKLLKIKIGYLDLDTNHQTFQGEKFSLEKERQKERTIFICFKVVTCNAMAMATMNITACLNSY